MTLYARIFGLLAGAALVIAGGMAADAGAKKASAVVASIRPDQSWTASGALAKTKNETGLEQALVFACMGRLLNGDYAAVDQLCGRAITLRPSDPVPHKLFGVSLLIQHRYERAATEFREAVKFAPSDSGSEIGLGEALRGQDDYNGAMEAFGAALTLTPRDGGIWNARCWTRGLFARQLREGLADCNMALALTPAHPAYLDSRGLINLRLGRLSAAMRDYNAAIAKNPALPTALYGRGVAWLKLGRFPYAVRDITKARAADHAVDDVFYRAPLLPPACRRTLDRCRQEKRAPGRNASSSGHRAA